MLANVPNAFLAGLLPASLAELNSHLRLVEVPHGTKLFEIGDDIESVAFPHPGTLVSFVVSLCEGQNIEAGIVGHTGIVGSSAIINGQRALSTAIVQLPGYISVAFRNRVLELAAHDDHFRQKVAKHEQFMYAQAQQTAACNASHDVQSRLCRWLLQASDLVGRNTLSLTQEFLAQILGVQRTSVTLVARQLQSAKLIKYKRGIIQLLDIEGLEEGACECRNVIKAHHQRLLGDGNEP